MKKLLSLSLALALSLGLCVTACAVDTIPFTDVSAEADYAEAVAWCHGKGILNGVSDTAFAPDASLSRSMIVTALYRAAGAPAVSGRPGFTDTQADTWYSSAVVWANQQGIVQGYGNGLFGTDDPVSVEQMEVILARYTGKEQKWVGDSAKAQAATRAQVAVALMAALKVEEPAPEVIPEPAPEGGKVLVAYFSNTNNTKGIAEKIAASLDGADLYQITPEVPYTAADLNYNTDCRANREQNDPDARPAISGSVENWEDYDVVFLGYPIWWGVPPKIMHTFMESYDFGGKTVIPFCTSGSSGYNDTALKELVGGDTTWVTGRRFAGSASQATIQSWVDGLELGSDMEEERTVTQIKVSFNGKTYTATLADNTSAQAFAAYLKEQGGSVAVSASDYGSFEKVGPLGTTLVTNNEQINTVPGDIILYQGSNICLYYAANSWNFTRLGKLEGDLSSLKADLGGGDVSITYSLAEEGRSGQ